MNQPAEPFAPDLSRFIPKEVGAIANHPVDLPRIAKDAKVMAAIEACLPQIPTQHALYRGDARQLSFLPDASIHLVVTSPPYWTLKTYRDSAGQMGHIANYASSCASWIVSGENAFAFLSPADGWCAWSATFVYRGGKMAGNIR